MHPRRCYGLCDKASRRYRNIIRSSIPCMPRDIVAGCMRRVTEYIDVDPRLAYSLCVNNGIKETQKHTQGLAYYACLDVKDYSSRPFQRQPSAPGLKRSITDRPKNGHDSKRAVAQKRYQQIRYGSQHHARLRRV